VAIQNSTDDAASDHSRKGLMLGCRAYHCLKTAITANAVDSESAFISGTTAEADRGRCKGPLDPLFSHTDGEAIDVLEDSLKEDVSLDLSKDLIEKFFL
jgi:hypothetical protein